MDYHHGYGQGNREDPTSRFREMLYGESGLMGSIASGSFSGASEFDRAGGFGMESNYGRESAYDKNIGYEFDREGSFVRGRGDSFERGRKAGMGSLGGERESSLGGERESSFRGVSESSFSRERESSSGRGRKQGKGNFDRDRKGSFNRNRDSAYGREGEDAYRSYDRESGREGIFDDKIMDSIMKKRTLEEQLSERERQLAYAKTLLHQKHQQRQEALYKRPMSDEGSFQDFKRPRYTPQNQSYGHSPNASSYGGDGSFSDGVMGPKPGGAGGHPRGPWSGPGRAQGQGSPGKGAKRPADKFKGGYMQTSPQSKPSRRFQGPRCTVCYVYYENSQHQAAHLASEDHVEKVKARNLASNIIKHASATARSQQQRARNTASKVHPSGPQSAPLQRPQQPPYQRPQQRRHPRRRASDNKVMPLPVLEARLEMVLQQGCSMCNVKFFKNIRHQIGHRNGKKHQRKLEVLTKKMTMFDDNKAKEAALNGTGDGMDDESILAKMPATLQKYDPTVLVGLKYVKKVTGWFCQLCDKFYDDHTQTSDKEASDKEASAKEAPAKEAPAKEASAKKAQAKEASAKEDSVEEANRVKGIKDAHCASAEHFINFKKSYYKKLKEKAEQEAQAKALEEAAKKTQAELEAASSTDVKIIEISDDGNGDGDADANQAEIEMMEELNEEELEADAVMEADAVIEGEEGEAGEEGQA